MRHLQPTSRISPRPAFRPALLSANPCSAAGPARDPQSCEAGDAAVPASPTAEPAGFSMSGFG
jgi:hypothetical protein